MDSRRESHDDSNLHFKNWGLTRGPQSVALAHWRISPGIRRRPPDAVRFDCGNTAFSTPAENMQKGRAMFVKAKRRPYIHFSGKEPKFAAPSRFVVRCFKTKCGKILLFITYATPRPAVS